MFKSTKDRTSRSSSTRSLWLALCLMFAAVGTAWADDVAKNTTKSKSYATLQAAFYDADEGDVIQLLDDYNATSEAYDFDKSPCLAIVSSITLDGNGHKLTVDREGLWVANVPTNARRNAPARVQASTYDYNVTIKDITIENVAEQVLTKGGRCLVTRGQLGSLTLSGVTLTTNGSAYNRTLQPLVIGGDQASAAKVTIENSKIIADDKGAKGYAITLYNPAKLQITGSTLKGQNDIYFGEKNSSAGSAETDATIIGGDSYLVAGASAFNFLDNSSTVDVQKTTFTVAQVATFGTTTGNKVTLTGADNIVEFSAADITDAADREQLAIAGGYYSKVIPDDYLAEGYICHKVADVAQTGKFLVEEGTYTCWVGDTGYPTLAEAVACATDGKFTEGRFSEPVPYENCAEGYVCSTEKNEDGYYVIKAGTYVAKVGDYGFETINAAIDAADDGVVTLIADTAVDGVVTCGADISSDVTLDLNNLTLATGTGLTLNGGTLTLKNGQLKGSVVAAGGKVVFDATCGTNDITVTGDKSLELASGKFTSDVSGELVDHAYKYLAAHYGVIAIDGEYTVKATNQISTVAELQALAPLVNSNSNPSAGKIYELTKDLDLKGIDWTPIGNVAAAGGQTFKGVFDGMGYTISNLTISDKTTSWSCAALFGASYGGTVQNLTLADVDIQSLHYAAAFIAYNGNAAEPIVVKNCHVKGGSIISTPELVGNEYDNGDKVGGIVGLAQKATIENCSVEDVELQAYRDLGGLGGRVNAGTITGNTVKNVTLTQDNTNGYNINSDGSLMDMSSSVGLLVGGNSGSDVKTQTENTKLNTATNVTITAPVYVAKIGEASYGSLSAAIAAATEGQTVEICNADTYTVPGISKNITVKGAVEGVVFNCEGAQYTSIASIPNGATFENVTMNFGTNDYHGFQQPGTINMKGCTLNGKFFSYGDMNFEECTFNAPGTEASGYTSNDYSMWVYAGNVTYTNCTINCAGKFANVYNEGNDGGTPWKVVATGCTFNSTVANKAAFNVKATSGSTALRYEVAIDDCEAVGEWPTAGTTGTSSTGDLYVLNALLQVDDIKEGVASVTDVESTNITVNGAKIEDALYTTRAAEYAGKRYDTLKEALDAAVAANDKNIEVNLLNDAELTIGPATSRTHPIGAADTESITINGNNHTLTFMTTDTDWNCVLTTSDDTKLVLNNMTIGQGGKNTKGTWNSYDIYFYGDVELNDVTSNRPLAFDQDATLKNVTVNEETKDVYGIWIVTNGQNVVMDNVTVNVPNGRAIAVKDQYVNTAPEETTSLKVENSTFVSAKKSAILVTAKYGAEIEANNLDITQVAADKENAVWVSDDRANLYSEVTLTGDATMIPEGGVEAYTVIRTTGEKVNGYYKDLAKAVADAEDGQTITLKTDFDLAATSLTIAKGITIEGENHSITSSAAQAVLLTGTGDVTFSNVNITASKGHGIQAGDDTNSYAGQLTLDNSTLTVAKRGIRVYKNAEGFGIVLNKSVVQSNKADPTTTYTTGSDAMALSLGTNGTDGYNVTITDSELKGFSYCINSVTSGSNLNVTMTGGKIYGRAAINVWGKDNTFTLDGVEVHGINNETGKTEAFACIVENYRSQGSVCDNNTYNINNCKFYGEMSEAAYTTAGSTATEHFMDLRAENATVNITGNTTYECNAPAERGGLLYDEGRLQGNTINLNATAVESLKDVLAELTVIEVPSEPNADGMYTLSFQGVVHVYNAEMSKSKYFSTLKDALTDTEVLENGSQIDVCADITVDEDIIVNFTDGQEFAFDCYDYTLTAGEGHILLPTGVKASATKATNVFGHVEERDDVVASTSTIAANYYTNCYKAEHHEVGYTAEGTTTYSYFEEAFAEGTPAAGSTITLQKDITLVQNVSAANSFTLNFDGHSLTRGEYTITLASGVVVTTDTEVADFESLFIAADDTYMVVEGQSGSNYTYTVKTKESEGVYEFVDGTDAAYALESDVEAAKVTYTRSFDEDRVGKYQAWFLPFDYTITEADLEQFTFYKIAMIANTAEAGETEASDMVWIHLNEMKAGDVLKANKPYIYKPLAEVEGYEFTSVNVTLKKRTEAVLLTTSTTTTSYSFFGTYAKTSLTPSTEHTDFYLSINGKVSYVQNNTIAVGPYRWYLRAEGNNADYARGIGFVEDGEGETTGIQRTVDVANGEDTWFTLDGHRVEVPGKGVYIRRSADGQTRKVSVK